MAQFEIIVDSINRTVTTANFINIPSLTQLEIDALVDMSINSIVHNIDTDTFQKWNGSTWVNMGSGGGAITVVTNYSALPLPTTVSGQFFWVSNSQGTSWLPGSLGGTYYNKGVYYSNGVSWEYIDTPYQATQIEVNAGVNNDKFVTPLTLTNATQFNTKLDTAVFEEQNTITKEPTGFPNRTDTTFSFDDGTRTFTIQPTGVSFDIWSQGDKITITTPKTLVLPNATGKYFIYFDSTATLGQTTVFDDTILNDKILTALVYYNATTGKGEFILDERHGLTMDWATHFHMHNSFGTRYYGGFGISYTLGSGSLDSDAEIALGGGTIADEDIPTTIIDSATPSAFFEQILSPIAQIPVVYKLGTGQWQKDVANNFPVKDGTGEIFYNLNTLGTYTLEPVSNNHFMAVWIFVTNEIDTPIVSILGNREDNSLANAKNNNTYATLDWKDLPSAEYKILYRIIYEHKGGYANTINARIVDVLDLRGSVDSTLASSNFNPVATHSSLIGLSSDDHLIYHNDTRGDIRYYTKTELGHFIGTTVITTSVTTTILTTNDNVILTGTSIDQVVNLGDATTYAVGKAYNLVSNNDEVVNIVNNSTNTVIRLEPYNTVELTLLDNSTADGVWLKKVTFATPDKGIKFRDEFNTGTTTTGMTAWSSTASGTGAGATTVSTLFGRRAVYQLSTGTTNAGRIAFAKGNNGVLFGNSIMYCYETQIYIPILSTVTDRYVFTCGYGDNIAAGDHLDGVYFEYDELTSGNFWRLKTANNGARTTTVTLVPVVAGTWIKLRIEANRAGTEVLFFINNAFVGNIITNIPTAVNRNTDLLYKIAKSVGATARTVLLDYCDENTYLNR